MTRRVYSHVLREHALGIGDIFAQAMNSAVSKSVSKPDEQKLKEQRFRCSKTVVRGGVEPPTFRFSGGRSYQLSYLTVGADGTVALPRAVLTGFEPATFTLTG